MAQDIAAARPEGFAQADFAGALRDGDEHDVHNDDSADEEGDGGNRDSYEEEAAADVLPEGEERVARFNGKVIFLSVCKMASAAHDLADFVDGFLNLGGGGGARGDAQRVRLSAVFLFIGAQRKNNPVVERIPERGALLFAHADHFARRIPPANFLSDGIDAGQQIFDEIVSDDADRRGLLQIGLGDVAASDEVHVVELGHLGSPGAEVGVFQRIQPALYFEAPGQRRADFLAGFAKFTDGQIVVPGDAFSLLVLEIVIDVGDDLGLLGDTKNVRAEPKNSGGHVLIRAVNQADYGDHGGHADNHPNQREDAAELVSPETACGNGHSFLEVHCAGMGHRSASP